MLPGLEAAGLAGAAAQGEAASRGRLGEGGLIQKLDRQRCGRVSVSQDNGYEQGGGGLCVSLGSLMPTLQARPPHLHQKDLIKAGDLAQPDLPSSAELWGPPAPPSLEKSANYPEGAGVQSPGPREGRRRVRDPRGFWLPLFTGDSGAN